MNNWWILWNLRNEWIGSLRTPGSPSLSPENEFDFLMRTHFLLRDMIGFSYGTKNIPRTKQIRHYPHKTEQSKPTQQTDRFFHLSQKVNSCSHGRLWKQGWGFSFQRISYLCVICLAWVGRDLINLRFFLLLGTFVGLLGKRFYILIKVKVKSF